MNKSHSCFVFVLLMSLILGTQPLLGAEGEGARKPNIVFFFSDDAGFADFGFQKSKTFKTPRLDQLAREGVKFTSAYVSASVCGPSRAGLMTGRYQQRFGHEENNVPESMTKAGLRDQGQT